MKKVMRFLIVSFLFFFPDGLAGMESSGLCWDVWEVIAWFVPDRDLENSLYFVGKDVNEKAKIVLRRRLRRVVVPTEVFKDRRNWCDGGLFSSGRSISNFVSNGSGRKKEQQCFFNWLKRLEFLERPLWLVCCGDKFERFGVPKHLEEFLYNLKNIEVMDFCNSSIEETFFENCCSETKSTTKELALRGMKTFPIPFRRNIPILSFLNPFSAMEILDFSESNFERDDEYYAYKYADEYDSENEDQYEEDALSWINQNPFDEMLPETKGKIKVLILRDCMGLQDFLFLCDFINLKVLNLVGTNVTDDELRALAENLENLEELSIGHNKNFTDYSILCGFKNLKRVVFFEKVEGFKKLRIRLLRNGVWFRLERDRNKS